MKRKLWLIRTRKCLNAHCRVELRSDLVNIFHLSMMSYDCAPCLPSLPAQRCPSLRYIIIAELRDTIPSSNAAAGLLLLDYHSGPPSMDTLKWKMKQLIR